VPPQVAAVLPPPRVAAVLREGLLSDYASAAALPEDRFAIPGRRSIGLRSPSGSRAVDMASAGQKQRTPYSFSESRRTQGNRRWTR
jgi:hypothetical protein